jgi:antitoxin YefM
MTSRRTPCGFVYAVTYTPVMSKTVPVREFRTRLADLLDEVADRREHITVTRRGRPAAVLVPVDEYEGLEERAEILSDEPTLAAIRWGSTTWQPARSSRSTRSVPSTPRVTARSGTGLPHPHRA